MDDLRVAESRVQAAQERRQFRLRRDVVGAPHREQRARLRERLKSLADGRDALLELVLVLERERPADAVAARHVYDEHVATVRRFPHELGRIQGLVGAAPEHATVDAEATQDRRHVGDLAEGVRDVADLHHGPELPGHAMAAQQVPHERLTAGQRHVWDFVPGPDSEPTVLDDALDLGAAVRTDVQVVLDQDRVAVQQEVFVLGVAIEDLQQQVEEADEARAVALVRKVPLAVPVRVGDEDEAPGFAAGFLSSHTLPCAFASSC